MRLLSENPEFSTREIAARIGVSHGSAYYILNALVEKGFIKISNFRNNHRKGQYDYLLTQEGLREKSALTFRFIKRKRQEFENLREEIKILEHEALSQQKVNPSKINKKRG